MQCPRCLLFQVLSEKKFSKAWKTLDTDGSGVIDFLELLVWWRKQKGTDKSAYEKLLWDAHETAVTEGDVEGVESRPGEGEGGANEEERLRTLWEIVDRDQSGFLDEEEVSAIFVAMGKKLSARKQAKSFLQMDTDASGEIEFSELLSWWGKQKAKQQKLLTTQLMAGPDDEEQRLQAIWNIIDVDGSGYLDVAEVKRVLEATANGKALDAKAFNVAWNSMDVDASGEIDFSELLVWWRSCKKKGKLSVEATLKAEPVPSHLQAQALVASWSLVESKAEGELEAQALCTVLSLLGDALDERAMHRLSSAIERLGTARLVFELRRAGSPNRGTGGVGGSNKEVQAIWDAVDKDKNGSLDREEMRHVVAKLQMNVNEGKFNKMFKQLDPKGIGKVYYPAFAAWCIKQNRKRYARALHAEEKSVEPGGGGAMAESTTMAKALWARFDLDSSGSLEMEEVRSLLQASGKAMSEIEIEEAMAQLDTDASGDISFGEFELWWERQDPTAKAQLELLAELNFDEFEKSDEV
eukprot:SAG11_NODE_420_length_9631_cov_12.805558_5_plen_524_part_00